MLVKDQMDREITLSDYPRRIISLVPSQTELLYDLGLREEVVGITKFCVHPDLWFREKTRIGGTKQYHFDRIKALQPDLIIGNKEENEKEQIEQLMKNYPVWMSDIYTLEDALDIIKALGWLVGRKEKALEMIDAIRTGFATLPEISGIRTAYLIWKEPLMAVGKNTFIDDMLQKCGFENVLNHHQRYPTLSPKELQQANPQLLLLSSEPFPFQEKHLQSFQELLPESKIILVDGETFSWYGSRLLKSLGYLKDLLLSV